MIILRYGSQLFNLVEVLNGIVDPKDGEMRRKGGQMDIYWMLRVLVEKREGALIREVWMGLIKAQCICI
jgi:hypothetical protein